MCREISHDWVVRLVRKDDEFRFYFLDKNINVNARLSSACRFDKETAIQLAKALNGSDTLEYKAKALLYTTSKRQKDALREKTNAEPDTLKDAPETAPSDTTK